MDFAYGFVAGGIASSGLLFYLVRGWAGRLDTSLKLEAESELLENRREATQSGRTELARRDDYVVTEGDLLGTLAGVMTKDHLQDSPIGPVKSFDMGQNWVTIDESDDLTGK